jgi:hypothetical protein
MSEPDEHFARLLLIYPRAYREERGEEILGTLLDASPSHKSYPGLRDVLDVTLHGMQLRLGLTADRFVGRVLGLAAMPGLVIAAVLSIFLSIFGEWLPHVGRAAPMNGPLSTVGLLVYIAWVLGAASALIWPHRRRVFAAVCVFATVLVVASTVGRHGFPTARPAMMALVAGFGLPCVFAPIREPVRHRLAASLAVGVTSAMLIWSFIATQRWGPFYGGFYWLGTYRLGRSMPYIAGAVLVAVCVFLLLRRIDVAGALVVLASPFVIVSTSYIRDTHGHIGPSLGGLIALVALVVWLVVASVRDLRRPLGERIGPA